jgi:hypothetical protein
MSLNESAPAPKQGVIFVYDLGDQRESETLVLFGRALVDWLYEWQRRAVWRRNSPSNARILCFGPLTPARPRRTLTPASG